MLRSAVVALIVSCATASAQTTLLSWSVPALPAGAAPSVAGPGDLNGDGLADAVVGAPYASGGCVTAWSGFDASVLWQVCVTTAGVGFGASVAAAGDVDFDGHSDIVVSAPGSASSPGYTAILSGSTGALLRTIPIATQTVDGGSDFDGDGVPDQLATYSMGTGPGQAGVHVFSGATGGILLTRDSGPCTCTVNASFFPDVDADGFDEILVTAMPTNGQQGIVVVLKGPGGAVHASIDVPGGFSVKKIGSSLGDVTGDGKPDIGLSSVGGFSPATFFAYSLGSGGAIPSSAYVWSFIPPDQTSSGFTPTIGNVARIGDVNGDGLNDLVISTAFSNSALSAAYLAQFILSGGSGSVISATTPTFGGTLGQFPPGPVTHGGDFNGDGIQEFIHGSGSSSGAGAKAVSSVPLPASTFTSLGGACGAGSQIFYTLARIGYPWSLILNGASPTPAEFVLDVGAPAPLVLGGCTWHPDLAHFPAWSILPLVANGSVTVGIPPVPTLAGTQVTAQAIVYQPASPYGFDLSEGLHVVLGF